MLLLAQTAATHASVNHNEPELSLEISIQDVRMAMQDCGALIPEKVLEEQEFDGEEDTRGVDAFLAWVMGIGNQTIRRIALEGADGAKEDYLTVLKKKHSTTDEDTRYIGTILGRPAEPRTIKVEGSEVASLKEWAERLKNPPKPASTMPSSRRQSSALSSLGDEIMEDMDF